MLENLKPHKTNYPCRVKAVNQTLDPADQVILANALEDETTWTPWALHVALKKQGIQIADRSIRKHRELLCSCHRVR